MATRSSHLWKSLPGNFDRLHTATLFDSDDPYGIPTVEKETWIPRWLHPYGARIRTNEVPDGGALHFFLDDYRFETIWNRPNDTLAAPLGVGSALSPMFSCYRNWPRVLQIYNTYRNRWIAAFWQENGVRVIPTVCWSDHTSYGFAFAGIPEGSTVATSAVGVKDAESISYFEMGYREMIQRLKPHHVVFYGAKIAPELQELAPITLYPTRWDSIRRTKAWLKYKEQHPEVVPTEGVYDGRSRQ